MFTRNNVNTRPIKVYRVIFENLLTGSIDNILIESTSSEEASSTVIERLGKDYDLLHCRSVKQSDLN